jgi:hypothetical protein
MHFLRLPAQRSCRLDVAGQRSGGTRAARPSLGAEPRAVGELDVEGRLAAARRLGHRFEDLDVPREPAATAAAGALPIQRRNGKGTKRKHSELSAPATAPPPARPPAAAVPRPPPTGGLLLARGLPLPVAYPLRLPPTSPTVAPPAFFIPPSLSSLPSAVPARLSSGGGRGDRRGATTPDLARVPPPPAEPAVPPPRATIGGASGGAVPASASLPTPQELYDLATLHDLRRTLDAPQRTTVVTGNREVVTSGGSAQGSEFESAAKRRRLTPVPNDPDENRREAARIGHVFPGGADPYHADPLALRLSDRIGDSFRTCDSCQGYALRHTIATGRTHQIQDPNFHRVIRPLTAADDGFGRVTLVKRPVSGAVRQSKPVRREQAVAFPGSVTVGQQLHRDVIVVRYPEGARHHIDLATLAVSRRDPRPRLNEKPGYRPVAANPTSSARQRTFDTTEGRLSFSTNSSGEIADLTIAHGGSTYSLQRGPGARLVHGAATFSHQGKTGRLPALPAPAPAPSDTASTPSAAPIPTPPLPLPPPSPHSAAARPVTWSTPAAAPISAPVLPAVPSLPRKTIPARRSSPTARLSPSPRASAPAVAPAPAPASGPSAAPHFQPFRPPRRLIPPPPIPTPPPKGTPSYPFLIEDD